MSSLQRFFDFALKSSNDADFAAAKAAKSKGKTDTRKVNETLDDTRGRDLAAFYKDIVIEQIILCLDTIADICDGPNSQNQRVLADGPLLEIMSKLLDSIDLQVCRMAYSCNLDGESWLQM